MRSAGSRLKDFPLQQRLDACGNAVADPAEWMGRWATWGAPTGQQGSSLSVQQTSEPAIPQTTNSATPQWRMVILDLGCGKGEYTVEIAKLHPDVLFIGLDVDGVCIVRSAERAIEAGLSNAVFIYDRDPELSLMFAEHELDGILMNFPTPFPNKKRAWMRLTYVDRLLEDRRLLKPDGFIRLRTDGMPLRDFSLTQLELAGYDVRWVSDDVRAKFPNEPWSGYEQKLVEKGARVCGFEAVPCPGEVPAPDEVQQTAPLSLVSYLPEDLEHMTYIPYGMEGCVKNMVNRRARNRARGQEVYTPPKV